MVVDQGDPTLACHYVSDAEHHVVTYVGAVPDRFRDELIVPRREISWHWNHTRQSIDGITVILRARQVERTNGPLRNLTHDQMPSHEGAGGRCGFEFWWVR